MMSTGVEGARHADRLIVGAGVAALFADIPEALENAVCLAQRCKLFFK